MELAAVFARRVVDAAADASARGRALSIVLPGGSVAETFLPVLADAALDWPAIDVFWGDERAVPPEHPDANYRLADELLLAHVSIPPGRVHRMRGEAVPLDAAALAYEAELERVLGTPPRFDIVLLGMGPDGHVCSLFPGHRSLEERSRRVIAVLDSPKPPPSRLTLTLPALDDAAIFVAAFGASKADVLRQALNEPDCALPVAQAARRGRSATFLLDPAAASRPAADAR
jgi:6-phosphogluconolactonase